MSTISSLIFSFTKKMELQILIDGVRIAVVETTWPEIFDHVVSFGFVVPVTIYDGARSVTVHNNKIVSEKVPLLDDLVRAEYPEIGNYLSNHIAVEQEIDRIKWRNLE